MSAGRLIQRELGPLTPADLLKKSEYEKRMNKDKKSFITISVLEILFFVNTFVYDPNALTNNKFPIIYLRMEKL